MSVRAHAMRVHSLICFDKEHNIRGQILSRLFVVMSLIDNVINALGLHPNIRDESNTNSKVEYSSIGSIWCLK